MIIWIASYPKSGNTWVRMFLKSYFQKANEKFRLDTSNLDSFNSRVFPNQELLEHFKIDYFKFEQIAKNWENMQSYINLNNKTNYIKTHNSMCTVGPYKFTTPENTKGAIYLVRDPRDVLVSYSYHLGMSYEETFNILTSPMSFENPANRSSKGINYKISLIGTWANHYNSWKTYKSSEILTIKYEEMLSNPYETFFKILEYLNKIDNTEINNEKLEKAISQTNFKELQNIEKLQGFSEKGKGELFFREGKTGVWKNNVDNEIIKKIEKVFKDEMTELGYLN